ncbi:unnamed protein product [Thelazia callipaeda]|uniref:DUF3715 domain-containing protein n=1 Tax=Thelazia callipaeda TaxID=103827 RepID=A0A0N5CPN1_THECL|nr:unnamed protein product [Thelazia callipaeda]
MFIVAKKQSDCYTNDLNLNTESFQNVYQRAIFSHLSSSCQDRDLIRILRCRVIKNEILETRLELISQYGVSVHNNFVGDLGEPSYGVYLSENPDLVTPAPFIGRIKLRILVCQILKGKCNIVGLGSYHLMPTKGCQSHAAVQPLDCKLTRHDNYRYHQLFLFEENEEKYMKSPANVLPYAAYEVEFAQNTVLSFKALDCTVWSGSLLIGNRRYDRISLNSLASAAKPPLLDTFQITDLIPWTACLAFPPILELLKPPTLGEIGLKKEASSVLLNDTKRRVYYFTLFSEDDSQDIVLLHESMRIRRALGVTIFPSIGIFILIPNGLFSDLLSIPKKSGNIFHCLYFTSSLDFSLIHGAFDTMSIEENDEFLRPLLLQERVDGLDARVQELVRNVAKKVLISEENVTKKLIIQRDILNTAPVDMDIDDSDNENEKLKWQHEQHSSDLSFESSTSSSFNKMLSKVKSCDPRREKLLHSRDPRKRPFSHLKSPTLSCSAEKRKYSNWSSVQTNSDTEKKVSLKSWYDRTDFPVGLKFQFASMSSDLCSTEYRNHSPSDLLFDGNSSPKTTSQVQQSLESVSSNLCAISSAHNDTDSPASPPQESGVFVATAPKIISDHDIRSVADSSFHMPVPQYRPPEVTPFTALTSTEALKNSISLTNKQHRSEVEKTPITTFIDSEKPEESMLLLPELISFPSSIKNNIAVGREMASSIQSPEHLRWNLFPHIKIDDKDTSLRIPETDSSNTGDVDMRTMHRNSFVQDVSHDASSSTAASSVPVMKRPIVLSNGDTDHRIISPSIRPSTSTQQPPSGNLAEKTIRLSHDHSFSPLTTFPSVRPPVYRDVPSTSHSTGFNQPRTYGFFNQPAVSCQAKPYFKRSITNNNYLSRPQRRGVFVIDSALLTIGSLEPEFFRLVLDRFLYWKKNGSISWLVKLHTHVRQALSSSGLASSSNPKLGERYIRYEEIIAEYENHKILQTMKPHECDKKTYDMNMVLKCLTHIANTSKKYSMIYLTDVIKDSPIGQQITCLGFEVCCSSDLRKKFSLS